MSFKETLEHLLDTTTSLKPAALYSLSKLETDELERLTAVWLSIPVTRRRTLVKELVQIAEANFEVNFESIFRWGLCDRDPQVRATSVEGLWESEDVSLMHELLHLSRNDPAVRVRAAAALSLGRFLLLGELGKLPSHIYWPVFEALRQVVQEASDDIQVRRRALESISYVTDETVVLLLQEAYEHPEEKMRVSAIFGMGRSADERWIETVMGELFSISPEMRYEAARACGELEARGAVSKLSELVEDTDREVQEVALWALGQIGGDEARRLLETYCKAQDEATRTAAEAALEQLEFLHEYLDFPFYEFDQLGEIE